MSETAAQNHLSSRDSASTETQRSRLFLWITVLFSAQLALVFCLGTKKKNISRPAINVPQFTLTAPNNELIALGNPTLFVLPQARDFSTKNWMPIPAPQPPSFRWQEPPRWLRLDSGNLGMALNDYLQTNAAAETPLNFKSEPQLDFTDTTLETFFPTNSSWQVHGALAKRKLTATFIIPNLSLNEVIEPSRVQLLVAPDGSVISVVLLTTSGNAEADSYALQLTRKLQFAPADQLTFGEITFKWHTEPLESSGSPTPK